MPRATAVLRNVTSFFVQTETAIIARMPGQVLGPPPPMDRGPNRRGGSTSSIKSKLEEGATPFVQGAISKKAGSLLGDVCIIPSFLPHPTRSPDYYQSSSSLFLKQRLFRPSPAAQLLTLIPFPTSLLSLTNERATVSASLRAELTSIHCR